MRTLRNLTLIALTILLLSTEYYTISPNVDIKQKQITYNDLNLETKQEVKCLADNIYFEARGEPDIGKQAIAYTTLNRVVDGRWADSICGVVKQKIGSTCQFSWICDKTLIKHKKDSDLYERCKNVAVTVYLNYVPGQDDITSGATFYHANYVSPKWYKLAYIKTIGNHLFYKIPT